jgi:hypothetical protein
MSKSLCKVNKDWRRIAQTRLLTRCGEALIIHWVNAGGKVPREF